MAGKWKEMPLIEVAEIYDGPHATPKKTTDGPIFLGISNISQGRLDLSSTEHLSEEDYVKWTRRVEPSPGDIVFSYETRLGEAAQITTGLRCCLGRRMGLLRPRKGKVDKRFLLYAYLGAPFQELLRARTVPGSTVDRIPLIEMPRFPITVPVDLEEQHAIAHILGTLDDKIELNHRMNETLETMARFIVSERQAEQAWCECELSTLCDIFDGPHATPKTTSSGPVFLGISSLAGGKLDLSETKHVSEADYVKWTKRVTPREGDIVFSYETRLGQVARIPAHLKCCLGRRMGLLRPKMGKVHSLILLHAFLSPGFQEVIRMKTVQGSTVERILLTEMGEFSIKIGAWEDQKQIVDIIGPMHDLMESNQRESRALESIRDALLPKLISGEMQINDTKNI